MRFLPYAHAAAVPNVIVDGSATRHTVLTLSHWPNSTTPEALRADTSTAIVFNYLDAPALHVEAEAVSNNHFDEDGLAGIYALLHPDAARRHRELLIDAAQAGDFGVYERRDAARIAMTLTAFGHAETSPLPAAVFAHPYPQLAAELYEAGLELLPRVLEDVGAFRELWEAEDARLTASEHDLRSGTITIDERPQVDLAIVTVPDGRSVHPFALHTRTRCTRLLLMDPSRTEFRYRYESWVQLASRRPLPRVDLAPLAAELNQLERSETRWVFDGVGEITPSLRAEGPPSSIPQAEVLFRLERHLRTGRPAWDPYAASATPAAPAEG